MLHVATRRVQALILTLALASAAPVQAQAPGSGASLYQRLGGYDVIAAIVGDFFVRFDGDPQLVPFLGGLNAAAGARIQQNFVDFICARTGGPCLYTGRDMRSAHEGLRITASHFERVMTHFRDALRAQEVPQSAASELLTVLEGLRSEIVP